MDLVLRPASPADADRVVALARQLGYDLTADVVRERLGRVAGERALTVAEDRSRGVVGWVEVRMEEEALVAARRCRVTGLVVDESFRGRGAGRALLSWAGAWAAERGASEAYLTSNVVRDGAHAFYERLGWVRRKTSHVYVRTVR